MSEKNLVFPQTSDYEDAIALGKKSFKTLDLEFEMSNPNMNMWTFGVGQFAVAFKAKMNGKYYAVRCFQHSTKKGLAKYATLSSYLKRKKIQWLSGFTYYENEIIVNNKEYPVLLMDWVEGVDIHEFISDNLHSNFWLLNLQKALVKLSVDLEKRGIGHGDLQKGNVIVNKEKNKVSLKLIDYDGMFVSSMEGEVSTELGKPDIQHPKRDKFFFNEKIDRFSIWLFITAIEALKYDKSLWNRISDGGFNDASNFLFSFNDLNNNTNSPLFSKLNQSSHKSVRDYSKKLIDFCNNNIDEVSPPKLLDSVQKEVDDQIVIAKKSFPVVSPQPPIVDSDPSDEDVDWDKLRKSLKQVKEEDQENDNKKTGKKFDVEDKKNKNLGKKQKYKKGGKEFDVEQEVVLSSSDRLTRAVRARNMFTGLFAMTLILSLFLVFRYSDKITIAGSFKSQLIQAENTIQVKSAQVNDLKKDVTKLNLELKEWKSDYYSMKRSRDKYKKSSNKYKASSNKYKASSKRYGEIVNEWNRWYKTVTCRRK